MQSREFASGQNYTGPARRHGTKFRTYDHFYEPALQEFFTFFTCLIFGLVKN